MATIMLFIPKDNVAYNFRSEMILKLRALGHEVVIVCPYGKKIDFFTQRGCRFIDLPIDRRGTSLLNDGKLMLAYRRIIRETKPDVVLTYTTKCSVYGGMVCAALNVPYIINLAGVMKRGDQYSALERFIISLFRPAFRKASCMMYQNSYERDLVNRELRGRVHYRLIPGSGVNLEAFPLCEYPASDEKVRFNYVARIMKGKGIEEYLACAERIKAKHPEAEFVIYGDYDDDRYRPIIAELERRDIVRYGGIQLDMKPCIAAAHAVIHPSYYEGMTNVVLEHSASGRPCLGSDVPGVMDAIEDGKTGFVFKVRDVDSLVDAVERFLSLSHAQKAAMGLAAREKMEREFDRSIVTDIYLEEISAILSRFRAASDKPNAR